MEYDFLYSRFMLCLVECAFHVYADKSFHEQYMNNYFFDLFWVFQPSPFLTRYSILSLNSSFIEFSLSFLLAYLWFLVWEGFLGMEYLSLGCLVQRQISEKEIWPALLNIKDMFQQVWLAPWKKYNHWIQVLCYSEVTTNLNWEKWNVSPKCN